MPLVLDMEEELRLVPAFADLTRDVLQKLAAIGVERRLGAGAALIDQGTPQLAIHVLVRGAAKTVRLVPGARPSAVVLDVARAPALVADAGLFDGRPAAASVLALRASHVVSIERAALLRMLGQSPALSAACLAHLGDSLRRQVRRVDEISAGHVDDRVRRLLENLAADFGTPFGRGRFIAIPLRRKDIACMVNATTETVSRLLARFEREGAIRSSRDGIWWRDPKWASETDEATSACSDPDGRVTSIEDTSNEVDPAGGSPDSSERRPHLVDSRGAR